MSFVRFEWENGKLVEPLTWSTEHMGSLRPWTTTCSAFHHCQFRILVVIWNFIPSINSAMIAPNAMASTSYLSNTCLALCCRLWGWGTCRTMVYLSLLFHSWSCKSGPFGQFLALCTHHPQLGDNLMWLWKTASIWSCLLYWPEVEIRPCSWLRIKPHDREPPSNQKWSALRITFHWSNSMQPCGTKVWVHSLECNLKTFWAYSHAWPCVWIIFFKFVIYGAALISTALLSLHFHLRHYTVLYTPLLLLHLFPTTTGSGFNHYGLSFSIQSKALLDKRRYTMRPIFWNMPHGPRFLTNILHMHKQHLNAYIAPIDTPKSLAFDKTF